MHVDINFSEVPFSVVTSTNAGSVLHTAGWASGGARSYKFNITSGSVKKVNISTWVVISAALTALIQP